jgi:hypothetical protein
MRRFPDVGWVKIPPPLWTRSPTVLVPLGGYSANEALYDGQPRSASAATIDALLKFPQPHLT